MSSAPRSVLHPRGPRRSGGAPHDPLIGMIVEGVVQEVRNDTCFVHFDDPLHASPGSKARSLLARLHQDSSRAQFDNQPLAALSEYSRGKRLQIYLEGLRQTTLGQTVYYAHERWAQPGSNPWAGPALPDLAFLVGTVVRKAEKDGELSGYVIHLDTNLEALDENGELLEQRQHDIEVFLPLADIPEVRSELGAKPGQPHILALEVGDTLCVRLERWGTAFEQPRVSLNGVVRWCDTEASADPYGFSLLRLLPSAVGEVLSNEVLDSGTEEDDDRDVSAEAFFPTGTHCFLVDDQAVVLEEMGTLLQAAGALVTRCHADRYSGTGLDGVAHELFEAMRQALSKGQVPLCLIDYSLPIPAQGVAVMRRVHTLCVASNVPVPRWILISTSLPAEPPAIEELRSQGLVAALARPLNLDEVIALTVPDTEGPWQWLKPEELRFGQEEPDLRSALGLLLQSHQPKLRFAVVLEVLTVGKVAWRASTGVAPVGPDDLDLMLRETDLRALVRGRVNRFDTNSTDAHLFHQGGVKHTVWQGFGQRPGGGPEWVLGVGSSFRLSPEDPQWLLWQTTLRQAVTLEAWRNWAIAQSSFIVQGRLVNSLAHEVNNHHDSMLRQIDLTSMALSAGKETVAADGLAAIRNTVEREQRLADVLLRGLREREAHFDVPHLLRQILQLHQQAANDVGVELRVDSDVSLTLALPSSYIVATLSNLILNALKHQYRDHAAWVHVWTILERNEDRRTFLCINVEDNGPGVATSVQASLFRPGVSHAQSADERHGMGLWLSRRLMREIGGDLLLLAQGRGVGSVFQMKLPLRLV